MSNLSDSIARWIEALSVKSLKRFAANGFLIWFQAGLFVAVFLTFIEKNARGGNLLARLLDGFNLKRDILTVGVLRRFLMRAFDPNYFGKRDDHEQAVNEVLGGTPKTSPTASEGEPHRRPLADSIWTENSDKRVPKQQPILVAPVAADVATGNLIMIEPGVSVVDALSAACALPPWFAPQEIKVTHGGLPIKHWLVDGAAVAREPIQPVLDLIKQLHLHRGSPLESRSTPFGALQLARTPTYIELCVIAPYPTHRLLDRERQQMRADMGLERSVPPPLPKPPPARVGTLYSLRDIFSLRAAHAAKDERNLVVLRNIALANAQKEVPTPLFYSGNNENDKRDINHWHVFAHLREIEPQQPVQVLDQLIKCSDSSQRRSVLRKIIADGCRASLLSLYRSHLKNLPFETLQNSKIPPCRALQRVLKNNIPLPGSPSDMTSPPGIAEICKECLFLNDIKAAWKEVSDLKANGEPESLPDWGEPPGSKIDTPEKKETETESRISPTLTWPLDLPDASRSAMRLGRERSTVTLVFSGGVFRGVFQVGVLNALNEAGFKPDVVAGASVGTITAAFAARIFTEPDRLQRQKRIAAVAATFLAIDRLVLTDRFADFIRRFTLRAGSANFSLTDADHLFRRFDKRSWELLSARSRRVLAGIHRMAYLDPIELLDLLGWNSPRDNGKFADRLQHYGQDALDRAGIGTELLGAEPLEQLIRGHVLRASEDRGADFDEFLLGGIHFLATTTNLTTGEIDVLGSFPPDKRRRPALIPGLLASSAFPAVFRPRMNWELRAGSPGFPEELVDGGIADNLPIVPLSRFLFLASRNRWLSARPKEGPHLLFTASLEPKRRKLDDADLKETVDFWVTLSRRVNQLRYNVKIDTHRRIQTDIRRIYAALKRDRKQEGFNLLDLHVSCVKPEWLSGTFAFHPMLGFRRERQARSIAHGCASTLAHLHREERSHGAWVQNWWGPAVFDAGTIDVKTDTVDCEPSVTLNPGSPSSSGACYFRSGLLCPFSKESLKQLELLPETTNELSEIYRFCGQSKTHRRSEEA